MTRKHQPGCPCCGDCVLVPLDPAITSSLVKWTITTGIADDLTTVDSALVLADSLEIIHTSPHPYLPYSMKLQCEFWADATGEAIILIAMSSNGNNGLVVRFSNHTANNCGEMRVYQRTAGVETLIGQEHVIDPLPYEAWHLAYFCWDYEAQQLTITLPDSETLGYLSSVTETTVTAVDGAYFGFGCAAGTVKIRKAQLTAIGEYEADSYTGTPALNCPECTTTCQLASDEASDSVVARCIWTKTGTWANDGAKIYALSNPATITNQSIFDVDNYIVSVHLRDFTAGDTVKIYLNSSDYISIYVPDDPGGLGGGTYEMTFNGTAFTNIGAYGPNPQLTICATDGGIYCTSSGTYAGSSDSDTAYIAWIKPAGAFSVAVTISSTETLPTVGITSIGVSKHGREQAGCANCGALCNHCGSEVVMPDTVYLDFGSAVLSGSCDDCDLISGVWPLSLVRATTGDCEYHRWVETNCSAFATGSPPNKEFCEALKLLFVAILRIQKHDTLDIYRWHLQIVVSYRFYAQCNYTASLEWRTGMRYLAGENLDCTDSGPVTLTAMTNQDYIDWLGIDGNNFIGAEGCTTGWPSTVTIEW